MSIKLKIISKDIETTNLQKGEAIRFNIRFKWSGAETLGMCGRVGWAYQKGTGLIFTQSSSITKSMRPGETSGWGGGYRLTNKEYEIQKKHRLFFVMLLGYQGKESIEWVTESITPINIVQDEEDEMIHISEQEFIDRVYNHLGRKMHSTLTHAQDDTGENIWVHNRIALAEGLLTQVGLVAIGLIGWSRVK